MSRKPKSAKSETAPDVVAETSPQPGPAKVSRLMPQSPGELLAAGYSIIHCSDDGLVFVLRKGANLVRAQCELYRSGGDAAARIVVTSLAKIP